MALEEAAAASAPATNPSERDNQGEELNYVLHEGRALGSDLSSYLDVVPDRYDEMLQAKVEALLPAFAPFMAADAAAPEVFRSPARHYRLRCKLGVGVLPPPVSPSSSSAAAAGEAAAATELTYLMWDSERRPVPVADFPIASRRINELMPRLLAALEAGPPVLRRGLRAASFLDTLAGDTLVSLMYKAPIADDGGEGSWAPAARRWLRDGLGVQVCVGC